jgi:hypothetical protein
VIRRVNNGRETTTFGPKSPGILIKNIEIPGVQNHNREGCGPPPRSRLEQLGRAVSPVTDVLEEDTRSGVREP